MEESNAVKRFLRYVQVNTQSDPESTTTPSTKRQFDLQRLLQKELNELNVKTTLDEEHCILYAELPATNGSKDSLGFFTHVDTAPDAPGEGVKPIIHQLAEKEEDVQDLVLPTGTVIDKEDLKSYHGQKIITSSGDTLLGADDKSGVSISMETIEQIVKNNIPHPRLLFVFTPDEEIGKSCDNVKPEDLKLTYAYSIDGDELGTYNNEGFNAFGAVLKIEGHEVHPGSAYGIMEDAGYILSQFYTSLPSAKRPENTKEGEGYILCTDMKGCVMNAEAKFIIRSFSVEEMDFFISLMKDQCNLLQRKYARSKLTLTFEEQYRNMKRYLPGDILENKLIEAMNKAHITPKKVYMRGGADCSHLSAHGLPCINMFAGGVNFHSRREFVPIDAINGGVAVLKELVQIF